MKLPSRLKNMAGCMAMMLLLMVLPVGAYAQTGPAPSAPLPAPRAPEAAPAGKGAAKLPDNGNDSALPAFVLPGDMSAPNGAASGQTSQSSIQSKGPSDAGSAQNALPSDDGVNPRAPGLQLTSDPDNNGASYDPFAEKANQPSPQQVETEIRNRSYNAAVTGLMPLKTDEIRQIMQTYDKTQQAVETPIYPYPEPQIVVQTVSLDPGVTPPEIKVATGHVTTVSLLDVTGAPWPIQDVSWAGNFEIVQPEPGGSVMRITPMSEFAYGNLSIRLVGLNTPVTFIVKTHRDVVEYRFDARIAQHGPNAKPPVIQGSGPAIVSGNSAMGSILDGVAPDGAASMTVDGVDGRTTAYKVGKLTYLRTPLTLLSPGWSSSTSSGDGMNVYELSNAPVVLLSDDGQVVRARLSTKGQDK